ncbi:TlpA family protein disulfide reductase [Algoriphagus namhaensis]
MKFRITFLFLLLVACTEPEDKSFQNTVKFNNQNPNMIMIINSSDKIPPYIISKELTFEELLKGEVYSDTIYSPDTLLFQLNESVQLIDVTPTDEYYPQSFLVKTGDTLDVQYINSKINVNRIENGKFIPLKWDLTQIIPKSKKFLYLDSIESFFLKEEITGSLKFFLPNVKNKDEWSFKLPEYLKLIDENYSAVVDSLNKYENSLNNLYSQLIKKDQVQRINNVLNIVNNKEETEKFYSKYLIPENFRNRYLSSIYGIYYMDKFHFNKDITLTEAYDRGFPEYPKEIARYFKFRLVSSMIIKKYRKETVFEFLDKYKEEYGDFSPLENILSEMEYGIQTSTDLALIDYQSNDSKWEEIKKKWKGKIIYVDFWASWCAPCLRAMPYSKELKEKLAGKEIVFVYLALNDREDLWRNSTQRNQIIENNFFIKNSKSSEFISNYNINAIPRYMIFDKNGMLIHEDAPGPDTKEAFEILTELLKL